MKVHLSITCIICTLLIIVTVVACSVLAREFRTFKTIPTPKVMPKGAEVVEQMKPVDRRIMEKVINKLMASWNTPGMEKFLGEDFFDKSRLVDAMDDKVPRDARLRILSIQGIQTQGQYIQKDASGREWVESIVTAIVTTQLEFNDPISGFQRREGVNEYTFRIRKKK